MALSRALSRHLTDDDSQPLLKRLKLAENTFTAIDVIVSRKEDFILNWLCEVSRQSNDITAWQTLKRCLEFQHIHAHTASIKGPVKDALVETMMTGLKTNGELELTRVIINCYLSIILNREMQRYFVYRPNLIVDLSQQLLSCTFVQSFMKSGDDITIIPELCDCIVASLNILIECHRRLANKTQLRSDVIERLIYKLCIFSGKIVNDKVTSAVTKCMQRFLFDKSIEASSFKADDWAQELYTAFSKYADDVSNDNGTILVISHIFHAVMKTFKSSMPIIDKIYRSILHWAPSLTLKVQICGYLFRHLNDITLDIQMKVNNITLATYYHDFIDEMLALDYIDDKVYRCLDGIASLNPLIIETKSQDIFKKILLSKKSSDIIKSSYTSLMTSILNAFIRLRRENNFVVLILMALDESLNENQDRPVDVDDILPSTFTDKFTASVYNMTNVLVMEVLQSFIHHFDTCCSQSYESNKLCTIMEISSRLIITFLEGIHIFDYSTPLAIQQKFVNELVKLGKILEKLINVVKRINKYEGAVIPVLSIINCWQSVIAFMKHYAPESLTEENNLLILQTTENLHRRIDKMDSNLAVSDSIAQLINCCRLEKNRINGNLPLEDEVLDYIKYNWRILMNSHTYIVENLNDSQLFCLARLILSHTYNTETNTLCTTWIESRIVQQNKKLIIALIFEIFIAIKSNMHNSSSTTCDLLSAITSKHLLDDEKTRKILKVCKKLLFDPQWTQIECFTLTLQYLKVLVTLPLLYLSVEWRTIIFLVIFSMTKESVKSTDLSNLCYQIQTDILEDGNIDILPYINLQHFFDELSKNSLLRKALECSLRNINNYDSIAKFIKSHKNMQDAVAPTVLECIENVKPRLKSDEKNTVKRIEKKLCKKLLSFVENDTTNPYQIKNLRIALKTAVVLKKLDASMLNVVDSTLQNVFQTNDNDEEHPKLQHNFHHNEEVINEVFDIIKILLQPVLKRNDRVNQIFTKDIMKRTWSIILTNPRYDIIPDLFDVQRTTPKILKKVLNLLNKQIVDAHNEKNVLLFENSMKIWNCVARADMPTSLNQIRQLHVQQLLQYFGTVTLSNDDCLNILKLCTIIINSKRAHITEKIIDLILLTAQQFLTNSKIASTFICEQILALCLAFITHRLSILTDRLPALLFLYRRLIRFIVDESKHNNSSCVQHQLQCLALDANKLAVALVKLKKDINKISPYVIADLIEIYSEGVIPAYVKEPLDDCIGMFLSNTDHHAVQLLFRALPSAMQEIFKNLYDSYIKFYKFTGKI